MRSLAFEVHLYCPSTPLREAMSLSATDARELFESSTFKKWQEGQSAHAKNTVEIINRLNLVIQAVGNVTKSIGNFLRGMQQR